MTMSSGWPLGHVVAISPRLHQPGPGSTDSALVEPAMQVPLLSDGFDLRVPLLGLLHPPPLYQDSDSGVIGPLHSPTETVVSVDRQLDPPREAFGGWLVGARTK